MDRRTLTALKKSIQHWEENAAAKTPDDASVLPDDCALCVSFLHSNECAGCPVYESQGNSRRWRCAYTPYRQAAKAFFKWRDGLWTRRQWQTKSRRELAFLKSLLPKAKP